MVDAIVVGSGPNGLTAACVLAAAGRSVIVLEAADEPGGGTRCSELTLPGFLHDVCSAVHPMGVLSPAFKALDLEARGLEWVPHPVCYAHPLDGMPAALALPDLDATVDRLEGDGPAYRRLVQPFVERHEALFADILGPLGPPGAPITMARFGLQAVWSARQLADHWFGEEPARALLAGCAGHAVQPLDNWLTAAFSLVFLVSAHCEPWPVVRGGSQGITRALLRHLEEHGGEVRTGHPVRTMSDLPDSRVVLFDLAPTQVAAIAGEALPTSYRDRLGRYVYGPGSCKVDFALDGPIPWVDEGVGDASTVHLGGTLEEIAAAEAAVWRGEHPERPYVILCQQSAVDPDRAPPGQATGYAYCHVPNGSAEDQTDRIFDQIERFAPGFRDRVLAKSVRTAAGFEAYNPAYVGGAVVGGPALPSQVFTRPVARLDPYTTPNPRLFLCSQATPPGGGVHGMCGWHAAHSALRRQLS